MAFFNRQKTALTIIQDVCGQLGLPVPSLVSGNVTDETAQQMLTLLNFCGNRLIKPTNGNRWQVLARTWKFTSDPAKTLYDVPLDWSSFIDETAWNLSTSLPMIGPTNDMDWARLLASNSAATMNIVYRTRGGKFEILISPSSPQNLSIDYISRAWVQGTDPTLGTVYKDSMTDDADLCLYDGELITAYLKLRFLIEKGMDTTIALNDFQSALDQAQNADQDAPMLATGSYGGMPLVNTIYNVPNTNYGY